MAISRQKKEELVALYQKQIENATAMVFTDFRGVTVPQVQSLRAKLRENGAQYMIVKNTLFGRALDNAGRPRPDEFLDGPNAIVFLDEDVIGKGVTALKDWIKAEKVVEINGGIIEESILDAKDAAALANLPTKEQTLAAILGVVSAPSRQLVRMINAPASSLARVISARVEQMQEEAA